jgi:Ni/Co efflux regulator RcnB
MRNITLALAAVAAMALATPASAQDRDYDRHNEWRHGDRDHGRHEGWRRHRSGVSIEVGRAYARDCSVRVSKTIRSNGTVITRRVKSCD